MDILLTVVAVHLFWISAYVIHGWAEKRKPKRISDLSRWSIFWYTRIRGQRIVRIGRDCQGFMRVSRGNPELYMSYQQPFQAKRFVRQVAAHWLGVGQRSREFSILEPASLCDPEDWDE